MLQRKMRLAALGLAVAITASSTGMQAHAANLSDVLPAAGIGLTVSHGTSLAKIKSSAVKAEYKKEEKRLSLSELELMVLTNKLSGVKGYATASSRIKDNVLIKDETPKESVLPMLEQKLLGEETKETIKTDVADFLSKKNDFSQESESTAAESVAEKIVTEKLSDVTEKPSKETITVETESEVSEETTVPTENSDVAAGEVSTENKEDTKTTEPTDNTSQKTEDTVNNDEVKISDETSEETETSENVEEKKEDAVKSDKTEETILLPATTVSGNSVSAIAEAAIKGEDVSKPTVVKTEKNIEEAVSDKVTKLEEKVIETTMSAAEMEVLRAANMTDEERSFEKLVIADVNDYVNVRDKAGEDGEIVGKLYDGSVGNYIEEENGWYKINSGNVTGFVKGEFCVTGHAAIEMAKEVGIRMATVETEGLRVRAEASLDAEVVGQVPEGEDLTVSEQVDGWVKVSIEEGDGWVSTEYVSLRTDFAKAESKAEEEARLEKEAEERRKAQEAAAKKASESKKYNAASSYVPQGEGSSMGNAVAQYALQFVGNPYVYGGTSLTNGADCSGFVMSVYKNFGVSLPHSSKADRSVGYGVASLAEAQPGDLICYSGHVALYIGGGKIVHASTRKTGIIVSNAAYKNILAIRRIF